MKHVILFLALPLLLLLGACSQTRQAASTTATTPTSSSQRTVVEIAASSPEHSTLIEAVNTVGLTETLSGDGPFTIFAPTNAAFAKLVDDLDWDEENQNRDRTTMDADPNSIWNRERDTTMQNPTYRDTSMQNPTWNQERDTTMQDRTYRDNPTYDDNTMRDTIPGTMGTNTRSESEVQQKASAVLLPENKENLKTILQYHVVRGNYDSQALAKAIQDGNGKAQLTTVHGERLTITMKGNDFVLEDARGAKSKVTSADLRGSNGVIHVIDQVALPVKENTMER